MSNQLVVHNSLSRQKEVYLTHLGYKVRYVRNITDVGHLEGDADSNAEDKIAKKARLEQLEPMEVVQRYMNDEDIQCTIP